MISLYDFCEFDVTIGRNLHLLVQYMGRTQSCAINAIVNKGQSSKVKESDLAPVCLSS